MSRTSAPQRPSGAAPAEPAAGATDEPPARPRRRVRVRRILAILGAGALVLAGAGGVVHSLSTAPDAPAPKASGAQEPLGPQSIKLSSDVGGDSDTSSGARSGAGSNGDGSGGSNSSGGSGGDRGESTSGTAEPTVHRLTRKTHMVQDRSGKLVEVSRDVDSADLRRQAGVQTQQRMVALQQRAQAAQNEALKRGVDQWVLPLAGYQISAGFGQSGKMWVSTHSGQDFAASEGTPLVAIDSGVIIQAGYDRDNSWAGNLTVLRLEDGTELWYAHQSKITVEAGDDVQPGQVIGAVGTTGNSTGPHLHLEVRPGGGEAIDPVPALLEHGISI